MLIGKRLAHDDAALHEAAGRGDLVPLGGQVERDGEGGVGRAGDRDHRLRQHGDVHLAGGERRVELRRLGIGVVDGDVRADGQAIFLAQVLEDERRVLHGDADVLAAQVGKGRDALRAVGHDVEHAARVEREHLHGAVGLVVERGGGVRRQGGDVGRAVDERGGGVARVGLDGEVVAQRGRAGLAVGHELGHAEAGRAVERDDVDGQVLVDGGGVVLLAAGGEGEHHDDGQQHRREFAQMGHCRSLLFV